MKKTINPIIALISSFVSLASFAMPAQSMANENIDVQYLVIQQDDGTEDRFALKEYPAITFAGDVLVVETSERKVEVDIAEVVNYSFVTVAEELPTAIGMVNQDATSFSYSNAEFSGLATDATVAAYSINGQLLTTIKAEADGKARLDLSSLPKGTIILRTPNKTIKIINK